MNRLLLVSNSTCLGQGYLDHCMRAAVEILESPREVLFVPYALRDREAYAAKARERFAREGIRLRSIHEERDPEAAARNAPAFFVGGGNTFRLLDELDRNRLLDPIRRRVAEGAPYLGSSAGSNVACPTIKTTNDMPIVQPRTFEALGLVPFNINPHYLDPDPGSKHMGETRETRIREFHEMNDAAVVGLREGAWLRREGSSLRLEGSMGAKLFRKGRDPEELRTGADLSHLLRGAG